MSVFLTAIGLALFIEGLVYGGFPSVVKKMMAQALAMPDRNLRLFGFVFMFLGLAVIWLSK
ncbi:DUF2065 domain-containing protein [Bartonella sp. LJL80]